MYDGAYNITGQNPVRGLNSAGQLVDMYEVHYEGPASITGWVRVEQRTATPQLVDELIRRRLDEQVQIQQLGGNR